MFFTFLNLLAPLSLLFFHSSSVKIQCVNYRDNEICWYCKNRHYEKERLFNHINSENCAVKSHGKNPQKNYFQISFPIKQEKFFKYRGFFCVWFFASCFSPLFHFKYSKKGLINLFLQGFWIIQKLLALSVLQLVGQFLHRIVVVQSEKKNVLNAHFP